MRRGEAAWRLRGQPNRRHALVDRLFEGQDSSLGIREGKKSNSL
jgi:hypothetical protein